MVSARIARGSESGPVPRPSTDKFPFEFANAVARYAMPLRLTTVSSRDKVSGSGSGDESGEDDWDLV